jgi:hypothetical protein
MSTRGDGTDLDESIEAGRAAVEDAAPKEPARAKFLYNLGTALLARFERTGDDRDLHAAIDAGEEAVRTAPAGHPDLPAIHTKLGAALQTRAERTGAGHDDAVQLARAAVHAVPAGHLDRALVLVSLGIALHERAERTSDSKDLDEAIVILRAAAPAGGAGRLNSLANALRLRHDRIRARADLDDRGGSRLPAPVRRVPWVRRPGWPARCRRETAAIRCPGWAEHRPPRPVFRPGLGLQQCISAEHALQPAVPDALAAAA